MIVVRTVMHVFRNARTLSGIIPIFFTIIFFAEKGFAGEIEPRAFGNTPVGVNFLIVGYAHSKGGMSTAAASPLQDAKLNIDTGIVAYVRTLNIAGKPGKIDVVVPYSGLSGSALFGGQYKERTVSGFHDPLMRLSVNFYGAPVLSLKEFSEYHQDLLIGASVQVSPPLGQYDPEKMVNLGTNRWFIKPDLGVSKAWGTSLWSFPPV
jgi:hypothetical protein